MAPVAVNDAELPIHTLLGLAIDNTGRPAFTVIVILFDEVQFEGEVAVNAYTELVVGDTTSDDAVAPVLHE